MSLVTLQEILNESIEKNYAVGAFDTLDHITTESILTAAEELNAPVIMMVVDVLFSKLDSAHFFKYIVDRCQNSKVPVALHLDHANRFEDVMKAIHFGCTSVMLDGSSLPIDENIALTKKVCQVAHSCGVSVEGEIGHVAGHEGNMLDGNVADESAYTKVPEAVRFVEETGVDALAVAIGTVHGVYKGEPKLDYARLAEIRKAISIPLVMHGGSGLAPEQFKQAVASGMNKINFFTGMSLGGAQAVIDKVEERKRKLQFFELADTGYQAMKAIVKEHIQLFGTKPLIVK